KPILQWPGGFGGSPRPAFDILAHKTGLLVCTPRCARSTEQQFTACRSRRPVFSFHLSGGLLPVGEVSALKHKIHFGGRTRSRLERRLQPRLAAPRHTSNSPKVNKLQRRNAPAGGLNSLP